MNALLRLRGVEELVARSASIQPDVDAQVAAIVADVRDRGEAALREYAGRFDGLAAGAPLAVGRDAMREALGTLPHESRERLTRMAGRIRAFAEGQRRALGAFEMSIPGGAAGHEVAPVHRVGCYAPGGRYPLPSSLLMTAVTARAAGVEEVWIASPRPDQLMLACGALVDADGFVAAGGAQAIAAMAFGAGDIPPCDMIVGPGNAYVTAAKRLVFGVVGIDALAGPSELVVVADDNANPDIVAADLLAQAEHDPLSIVVLVSLSEPLLDRVNRSLDEHIATLPTGEVAKAALGNGGAILVRQLKDVADVCNRLAPEHLHLQISDPSAITADLRNFGALFIGEQSAEVLGDYGAGPNHVLPTGGASRFSGGLSVFSFLRVRSWLSITDENAASGLYDDAAWLARTEGLFAHAQSAELRIHARGPRVPL